MKLTHHIALALESSRRAALADAASSVVVQRLHLGKITTSGLLSAVVVFAARDHDIVQVNFGGGDRTESALAGSKDQRACSESR